MNDNICHFVPFHKDYHSLHTLNFVYETNLCLYQNLISESVYKMYFVCEGNGFLHTTGKINPIKKGDIFFTFPANPFKIESTENLKFMYISFVGARGNILLEESGITKNNFLILDCDEIFGIWENGINYPSELSGLVSESILLYTSAYLSKRLSANLTKTQNDDIVSKIKKYIDDNYTIPDFSLENISREYSYNKKYISNVFKAQLGIGFVEYLNMIRIQNACTMIEQGFRSVCDIAVKCGYSDPQYFSKVFKNKIGLTPTQYINSLKK